MVDAAWGGVGWEGGGPGCASRAAAVAAPPGSHIRAAAQAACAGVQQRRLACSNTGVQQRRLAWRTCSSALLLFHSCSLPCATRRSTTHTLKPRRCSAAARNMPSVPPQITASYSGAAGRAWPLLVTHVGPALWGSCLECLIACGVCSGASMARRSADARCAH